MEYCNDTLGDVRVVTVYGQFIQYHCEGGKFILKIIIRDSVTRPDKDVSETISNCQYYYSCRITVDKFIGNKIMKYDYENTLQVHTMCHELTEIASENQYCVTTYGS